MRKLLIYSSILLLFAACKKQNDNKDLCNQDYIIAGDSLSFCYEITKIDSGFYYWSNPLFEIDLDNDNEFDLKFVSYHHAAYHGYDIDEGGYIQGQNPLVELLISSDTNYVSFKNQMDTINMDNSWIANVKQKKLSCQSYFIQYSPFTGEYWTDYQDTVNRSIDEKYIGVRIKDTAYTKYYWIKVSIREYNHIFIHEYGKQKSFDQ